MAEHNPATVELVAATMWHTDRSGPHLPTWAGLDTEQRQQYRERAKPLLDALTAAGGNHHA